MISFLPQSESLYRRAIEAVSDPADYFSSAEYDTLRREAAFGFSVLEPRLPSFFDVVHGITDGAVLGRPRIGGALSFPRRFLRKPSTRDLPSSLADVVDTLTQQAFFLGLATHYFLHTFPTRSRLSGVHIDSVIHEWFPRSIVARELLREYSKEANDLPVRIFEWWFDTQATSGLHQLRLGFWRTAKVRSFLRNLFFAGALLGMESDMRTRDVL